METKHYKFNRDLPEIVQNRLPEQAQDIFREAYNTAWSSYLSRKKRIKDESPEDYAYKHAWAAVKKQYSQKSRKWVIIEND